MAIKVLYVIGNLDVGGAERHLAQVLPRLMERDFSVEVFTFSYKGALAPSLERVGIKVTEPALASALRGIPSMFRKALLLPISIISFCYCLMRLRPAVVHFFLPQAYLLGGMCSLMFQTPVRVMSRRSLNRYQLKYPVLARLEHWLHRHMDAVLGNSQAVVQELRQEGVKDERLGLLYNGIDLGLFDGLPSRASIRKGLAVDEQALLMVCVANLIPYKGHADLIRALGQIQANLPSGWRIAMVGRDSGIGSSLRVLAEQEGIAEHILWLGERNDTLAIYSAADIGVLSSHQEGFSNSILEGMAAGAAMVVTDVGGNGEAVINGVCGLVVPPHDPPALAKALLALAGDGLARASMAREGQRRVMERFSLQACVEQYSVLYRALLGRRDCRIQQVLDSPSGEGG